MRIIVVLLIAVFLSSCQNNSQTMQNGGQQKGHTSTKRHYPQEHDSAPLGPIPTFFQKILPKNEPYSRYGNPGSYSVQGRKYQVLKTASGYKARGIASWYGTKFHKQRTSSGDNYDMYAMTAAHKTLPLPSYVRVKNLENGREAVVRVNDRGPFRHDREIDLSYAAAVKLGMLPKGTARVEVVSLVPAGKTAARYYVQAGAFNTRQSANVLRAKVAKLTRASVFVQKYQQRYVVQVGPFSSKLQSDSLKRSLSSHGVRGAFSLLQ